MTPEAKRKKNQKKKQKQKQKQKEQQAAALASASASASGSASGSVSGSAGGSIPVEDSLGENTTDLVDDSVEESLAGESLSQDGNSGDVVIEEHTAAAVSAIGEPGQTGGQLEHPDTVSSETQQVGAGFSTVQDAESSFPVTQSIAETDSVIDERELTPVQAPVEITQEEQSARVSPQETSLEFQSNRENQQDTTDVHASNIIKSEGMPCEVETTQDTQEDVVPEQRESTDTEVQKQATKALDTKLQEENIEVNFLSAVDDHVTEIQDPVPENAGHEQCTPLSGPEHELDPQQTTDNLFGESDQAPSAQTDTDDLFAGTTANDEKMPWDNDELTGTAETVGENDEANNTVIETPLESRHDETEPDIPSVIAESEENGHPQEEYTDDAIVTVTTDQQDIPPLATQPQVQPPSSMEHRTVDEIMPWENETRTESAEDTHETTDAPAIMLNDASDLFGDKVTTDEVLPWDMEPAKNELSTWSKKSDEQEENVTEQPTVGQKMHVSEESNLGEESNIGEEATVKKFSFLQDDDDLLDDDDSFLESEDDELEPKQESYVSEGISEQPQTESLQIPKQTTKYAPTTVPTSQHPQAQRQVSNGSLYPSQHQSSTSVGIVMPQQYKKMNKSADTVNLASLGSANTSFLSVAPASAVETQQEIQKLAEQKKKSDAYDFPLALIGETTKQQVHAKPVGVSVRNKTSPIIPRKHSSSNSASFSRDGLPQSNMFPNLPVNPYASVAVKSPVQPVYGIPNTLPVTDVTKPGLSLQTQNPTVSSVQNFQYPPRSIATPGRRSRAASSVSASQTSITGPQNRYAPQAAPVAPASNPALGPPPAGNMYASVMAPHAAVGSQSNFPARSSIPSMVAAESNQQHNNNLIPPLNTGIGAHPAGIISPTAMLSPSSLISGVTRGNHARNNSSVYAPKTNVSSSKYAPTVHPQYQQQLQPHPAQLPPGNKIYPPQPQASMETYAPNVLNTVPQIPAPAMGGVMGGPPMQPVNMPHIPVAPTVGMTSGPPISNVLPIPPMGTYRKSSAKNKVQQPQAMSAIDNQALLTRQFPIFHWNSSNKIVCGIPSVSGAFMGGNSSLTTLKVLPFDHIVKQNSLLKSFPGPLSNKTKKKDVEKWLETVMGTMQLDPASTQALVWCLLKAKISEQHSLKDISKILYNSDELLVYLSQPLGVPQQAANAFRLDSSTLMRVLSLLQIGDHDNALKIALERKDYAMALLISGLVGLDKWSTIVDQYLEQEFAGSSTESGSNQCANLLSLVFQIFVGNSTAAIHKFYGTGPEGLWAISNWRVIVAAVLINVVEKPDELAIPPMVVEFLLEFGIFLYHKDQKLAAAVLFMIAEVPFSNHSVLKNSDVKFRYVGNPKSVESVLWSELYQYYIILKNPSLKYTSSLLPQKLYHGFCLQEQGLPTAATKYIDYVSSKMKSLPKNDIVALNLVPRLDELSNRISESNTGWLTKPKLSSVWGQLDKSFNKYIGGDNEGPKKSPQKKVFDNFTPYSSNNSSVADLFQHSEFTPYQLQKNRSMNEFKEGDHAYPGHSKSTVSTTAAPHDTLHRVPTAPVSHYHPAITHANSNVGGSSANLLLRNDEANVPPSSLDYGTGKHQATTSVDSFDSSMKAPPVMARLSPRKSLGEGLVLPIKKKPIRKLATPATSYPPVVHQSSFVATSGSVPAGAEPHSIQTESSPSRNAVPIRKIPTADAHAPNKLDVVHSLIENTAPTLSAPLSDVNPVVPSNAAQRSEADEQHVTGGQPDSTAPKIAEKELSATGPGPISDAETVPSRTSEEETLGEALLPKVGETEEEAAIIGLSDDRTSEVINQSATNNQEELASEELVPNIPSEVVGTTLPQDVPLSTLEANRDTEHVIETVSTSSENHNNEQNLPLSKEELAVTTETKSDLVPEQHSNSEDQQTESHAGDSGHKPKPSIPSPAAQEGNPNVSGGQAASSGDNDDAIGLGIFSQDTAGNRPPQPAAPPKKKIGNFNPYSPTIPSTKKAAKRTVYVPVGFNQSTPALAHSPPPLVDDVGIYNYGGYKSLTNNIGNSTEQENQTSSSSEGMSETQQGSNVSIPEISTGSGLASPRMYAHSTNNKFAPIQPPKAIPSSPFEPVIKPSTSSFNISTVKIADEVDTVYNDVVEDESDDDEESVAVKKKEDERKKKEEEEEEDRKDRKSDKNNKESAGWFKWLKKDTDEKKAVKAKLGNQNSFYYDEELKRWVSKYATEEEKQKMAQAAAPPPPPVIKRKDNAIKTKPRKSFSTTQPPIAAPVVNAVLPKNPLTGEPMGPPALQPSSASPIMAPVADSGPSLTSPQTSLSGKKANGLDDILNISNATVSRRKKKGGRGYVNVMDNIQ